MTVRSEAFPTGILLLHPEGRINSLRADSFCAEALRAIAATDDDVIMDSAGIVYISSAGLRAVLEVAKALKADGRGRRSQALQDTPAMCTDRDPPPCEHLIIDSTWRTDDGQGACASPPPRESGKRQAAPFAKGNGLKAVRVESPAWGTSATVSHPL